MSRTIEAYAPAVDWSGEEVEEYTPLPNPAAVMRERLRLLVRRGSRAQRDAATLQAEHGERALVELYRRGPLTAHDRAVEWLLVTAGYTAGEQVALL